MLTVSSLTAMRITSCFCLTGSPHWLDKSDCRKSWLSGTFCDDDTNIIITFAPLFL